jgi:hypothetical protein
MSPGDLLYTPGRGLQGFRRKQFKIVSIDALKLTILSGDNNISIEKECFDAIERSFKKNRNLWLRVASLHDNKPVPNSVDKLIRAATGSNVARGNYVCSICEHCGLVRYAMQGNQKGIKLL